MMRGVRKDQVSSWGALKSAGQVADEVGIVV